MMDAAAAAAMSDPDNNRWFRRRWSEDSSVLAPTSPPPDAPDSSAWCPVSDHKLTQLGHDLLQQWRRERTSKEAAP